VPSLINVIILKKNMKDTALLKHFNKIINGDELLPKNKHFDYGNFFNDLGYTTIKPYSNNILQR